MFGKLTGWLGLVAGIAATVAGSAGVVGTKVAGIAAIVGTILAAVGGSIARPTTSNSRASDR